MFYRVVESTRWFSKDKKYSEINWANFGQVVAEFEGRIGKWYLEPGKLLKDTSGHFGFPVLALSCLLIDTLSQYFRGLPRSAGAEFRKFAANHVPGLSGALPTSIRLPDGKEVKTYAELLWKVRCGVLHEANIPLYSGIRMLSGTTTVFHAMGYTMYADRSACPVVLIDPYKLFDEVSALFRSYVSDLLDSDQAHDDLRKQFIKKSSESLGIDLGLAVASYGGGLTQTPTASG